MKWKDKLIKDLEVVDKRLDNGQFAEILSKIKNERVSLHLAIFSEPFLNYLLMGTKTIESRFSINNVTPFRRVSIGDIVFVKKSGGGVMACFEVAKVLYISNLKSSTVESINLDFGEQLCWDKDPNFLELKTDANFLSLIFVENLQEFPEFDINKADRTGWATIRRGLRNTLFDHETN